MQCAWRTSRRAERWSSLGDSTRPAIRRRRVHRSASARPATRAPAAAARADDIAQRTSADPFCGRGAGSPFVQKAVKETGTATVDKTIDYDMSIQDSTRAFCRRALRIGSRSRDSRAGGGAGRVDAGTCHSCRSRALKEIHSRLRHRTPNEEGESH